MSAQNGGGRIECTALRKVFFDGRSRKDETLRQTISYLEQALRR